MEAIFGIALIILLIVCDGGGRDRGGGKYRCGELDMRMSGEGDWCVYERETGRVVFRGDADDCRDWMLDHSA